MTPTQRSLLTRAAALEVEINRAADRGDVVAVRSLESDLKFLWERWKAIEEAAPEGEKL